MLRDEDTNLDLDLDWDLHLDLDVHGQLGEEVMGKVENGEASAIAGFPVWKRRQRQQRQQLWRWYF